MTVLHSLFPTLGDVIAFGTLVALAAVLLIAYLTR